MKIAVATPPYPKSIEDGLETISLFADDASQKGASILCFPETYLPGYPYEGKQLVPFGKENFEKSISIIQQIAQKYQIV